MKTVSSLALAALAIACAAPAFAAGGKDANKDTVRDPDSGITLHAPRHDSHAAVGTAEHKFATEVKAALQRVATATKRAAHRADEAWRDREHKDGNA
jgi:hypothetical protein